MADNLLLESILVLEAFGLVSLPSFALWFGYGCWTRSRISNRFTLQIAKGLRSHGRCSPSTLLISPGPRPVEVLLCLGREMPAGPTAPWISTIGAPVEGRRSRVGNRGCSVAMAALCEVQLATTVSALDPKHVNKRRRAVFFNAICASLADPLQVEIGSAGKLIIRGALERGDLTAMVGRWSGVASRPGHELGRAGGVMRGGKEQLSRGRGADADRKRVQCRSRRRRKCRPFFQ